MEIILIKEKAIGNKSLRVPLLKESSLGAMHWDEEQSSIKRLLIYKSFKHVSF